VRYLIILTLSLSFGCNSGESKSPDDAAVSPVDNLSGVYNVETVTCNGVVEPISVVATVTFDKTSYLEEWEFANTDCELSLAGTVVATDAEVTLEDVGVTCTGNCPPAICNTPCPIDQIYQYTRTGNELLLSFTQQGDEVACGPCGDGVPSTYLLVEKAN